MVIYLRINDDCTYDVLGEASNPTFAWNWAESLNSRMGEDGVVTYGCHCGAIAAGDTIEGYGVVQQLCHTSTHLMTVKI